MPGEPEFREFDDQGNLPGEGDGNPEVFEEEVADPPVEGDEGGAPAAGAGKKYRIGDKEFDTAEEAHAYATSQISTLETERQLADAYRQGIQDASGAPNPAASATPAAPSSEPAFDEQLYYADPAAFLKQYGQQITQQVTQQISQQLSVKEQSDKIWSEFVSRHPELADFREEVEQTAGKHLTELKVVNATKGNAAGYDFVALKVKSNFARYANATRPQRQLPNTRQAAAPAGQSGVTLPKAKQKPLSMAEQVRSIKPKGR